MAGSNKTSAGAEPIGTPSSVGGPLLEQAFNEYSRASQAAKNNPSAANLEAQKQAQIKVYKVAVQSGILDQSSELGKAFAKVAPELQIKLLEAQQKLGVDAASGTIEIAKALAGDERSSIKGQIDTLFGMESGAMRSSISFAGIGRAVCSFLRAIGVEGMDEYIQRFDDEIQNATDSVRDVKYKKLREANQVISSEKAEGQVISATDRAVKALSERGEETLSKISELMGITKKIGDTTTDQQAPQTTGQVDPIIAGTSRAAQLAKDAAKELGLKPGQVEQAVIEAAKLEGDDKNLSGKELAALEARLITGEGKDKATELIKRVKDGANISPAALSHREPALDLG